MSRHYTISGRRILEAVRLFRWITQKLLRLYFSGEAKRIKALEYLLPKLEGEGKLVSLWHRGEKVYSMPRKNQVLPVSLDHEIACTDVLIRLGRCRVGESQILPERSFRGFGIVPEGGIRYSKERGTMLILEFCTESNFAHGGVMKSKITRYKKYLPAIEVKFDRDITVLFIIDIDRARVKVFVGRIQPLLIEPVISRHAGHARYPFFFTDYKSLRSVPVGNALTEPIYYWYDGKEWMLSSDG
jgi:hypothetical protein